MKPGIIRASSRPHRQVALVAWLIANGINPNLIVATDPIIYTGTRIIVQKIVTRKNPTRPGHRAVFTVRPDGWPVIQTRRTVYRERVAYKAPRNG